MRMIGTLSNEDQARKLSAFLKRSGVENSCEVSFDSQSGHMSYQMWAHDEDQMELASEIYQRFQKNPNDPEFNVLIPEEVVSIEEERVEIKTPHRFGTHFTNFMLALCTLIFFLNAMEEIPMRKEGLSEKSFLITPVQAIFLYDLPPAIERLEKIIEKFKIDPNQKLEDLPPEIKQELQAAEQVPFWRGAYDVFILKIKGKDPTPAEGPLFERIRKGEVWRLFSPAILHRDLLHILFNMIWLWVLGRPIEQRIGIFKTALLTIAAAIGSNTVQYLISGPFFIGYSGIVMGLAGFIWMRERVAPWEGYPLNRATVLFLLFFIGAMFLLQFAAFFIQVFTTYNFAPNIANAAHIAGAVIGAALGRLNYFSQRVVTT
ncbi:MAG TPA: rhomboid family intramembrane serine protease [Chlamydiales bacterium]|nr:rhomboid family intramembrane serine protease [Chlamydiales bacterium]